MLLVWKPSRGMSHENTSETENVRTPVESLPVTCTYLYPAGLTGQQDTQQLNHTV